MNRNEDRQQDMFEQCTSVVITNIQLNWRVTSVEGHDDIEKDNWKQNKSYNDIPDEYKAHWQQNTRIFK